MTKAKLIYWGWDGEQEVIVYGHVDATAYAEACRRLVGDADEEPVAHLWGRWVPTRSGPFDRTLHMCEGPGRGAFAFTLREAAP